MRSVLAKACLRKSLCGLAGNHKRPVGRVEYAWKPEFAGQYGCLVCTTDSPLTVQDRLGSLVTFTSFSDTTTVVRQEVPTVSLGGLDMLMMVHIDPSVRVKVDLDASAIVSNWKEVAIFR